MDKSFYLFVDTEENEISFSKKLNFILNDSELVGAYLKYKNNIIKTDINPLFFGNEPIPNDEDPWAYFKLRVTVFPINDSINEDRQIELVRELKEIILKLEKNIEVVSEMILTD